MDGPEPRIQDEPRRTRTKPQHTDMIIVLGCERSGTDIIARQMAECKGLDYVEEKWANPNWHCVLKHSLNLDQNIKHIEFLEHYYDDPTFKYIVRDPREVCRSITQKIWGRYPHTVSLDGAIKQYREVHNSCYGWAKDNALIVYYERLPFNNLYYDYTPKMTWHEYFTADQIEYIHQKIGHIIDELSYNETNGYEHDCNCRHKTKRVHSTV